MNRNTVRWIIAALMLIALTLGLSYPSLAEDGKLPLDYRMGGYPPVQDGWTWTYEENGTQRTSGKYEEKAKKTLTGAEYSDPTISVSLTRGTVKHDVKGGKKNQDHEYFIVRVKINDVSQLRTAASNGLINRYVVASDIESGSRRHGQLAIPLIQGVRHIALACLVNDDLPLSRRCRRQ